MDSWLVFSYRPQENIDFNSSKVAAIEFDKTEEFFAIGGDLREIQVFPYSSDEIESSNSCSKKDISPLQYMVAPDLISSLSWSQHSNGQIACSDYSGIVTLWDASSASKLVSYTEHTGSVFSVDYSHCQNGVLASGSADSTVLLWDVRQPNSTNSISSSGAVNCVKFNPSKDYQLSFGSKNSCVSKFFLRKK